jgi:transporter family-2 protein
MWGYVALGLAAGAMLPVQAGINAALASHVDSPARAALVSFAVGTLALLLLVLVAFRGWPGSSELAGAPWWVWTGGVLGAFYVVGAIMVAPRLGAVTLVSVLLAGQALASLLLDHFGWIGYDEHAITPGRILGVLLVGAGVALVRIY